MHLLGIATAGLIHNNSAREAAIDEVLGGWASVKKGQITDSSSGMTFPPSIFSLIQVSRFMGYDHA